MIHLRIPLLILMLVGGAVAWAFPNELPWWRSAAIIFGWLGWGLLLSSLLLMIREPWLAARLGGLEKMYLWHHRLGVFAYLVLLLHPLALAMAAWDESPSLVWVAIDPWQQSWPEWLGWVALLCLMGGLAVALVQHLSYRRWRSLHHLLSLSVVFGFAHLWLLGLDYPLLWMPLLAIAFIVWRLLRADYGLAARPYLVSRVEHPAEGMVALRLRPLAAAVSAQAGQFVIVAFLDGPVFRGCAEYHPFTLSDIEDDGAFSLGIKALGQCTRHLQSIETGVVVRVQGPFGDFLQDCTREPALWVAGGIGLAPFLAVLRKAPLAQPVKLIYLHRNSSDAAYLDELTALAVTQPQLVLEVVESGESPVDLAGVIPLASELLGRQCYLCGPPGLLAATINLLQARGVSAKQIHFERFDFR